MHKWQIKDNEVWLCEACVRQLSPVIMRGKWQWLAESHNADINCARCKCDDITVRKFGRFRHLFRFLYRPTKPTPGRLKAYRRAL